MGHGARVNSFARTHSGCMCAEAPRERKGGEGVKLRWLIYRILCVPLPLVVHCVPTCLRILYFFAVVVEFSGDFAAYI